MSVRVLVVDDQEPFRLTAQLVVEMTDGFEVVGVAETGEGAVELTRTLNPDLVLMDVKIPGIDVVVTDIKMPPTLTNEGIQVAERLRQTHPHVGVVLVSLYDDPAFALALLEKGSQGRAYLLKEQLTDREQLATAIRRVAKGESV